MSSSTVRTDPSSVRDTADHVAWERSVPEVITTDALWKLQAYRLALFAADVAWSDVTQLVRDRRTVGLADQLNRAIGSISANIAEGYGRGPGRDRARFYEYALGSAYEARDWYYKARRVVGDTVARERIDLLTQIIRLLLTTLRYERAKAAPRIEEARTGSP